MNYSVVPKLGEILKEKGITQTQLSRMTGVPQSAISRFDKNKQHLDTHLIAISKALDLSIEDLFTIEEDTGIPRANTERNILSDAIPRDDMENRFKSIREKSTKNLSNDDLRYVSSLIISQIEKDVSNKKLFKQENVGFISLNDLQNKSKGVETESKYEEGTVLVVNKKGELEILPEKVDLDYIPDPKPPKRAEEVDFYEIDFDEMTEEINKKKV